MRGKNEKIISLILVCALCCTLFVAVSAKDIGYYEENSLHFYIGESYAFFTGCDEGLSGDVIIPAYVNDYPVVVFDDDALRRGAKITSITLPKTIKVVYTDGFLDAESLLNIYVDENNIDFVSVDGVLYGKGSDELIVFPKGRTGSYTVPAFTKSVYKEAFSHCKIEEVAFEAQLELIEAGTFSDCVNLKKITLPYSVEYIGANAFQNCTSLKNIDLPAALTSLDEGAFSYCTSLENINISSENEYYKSRDGVLFDAITDDLIQYPAGNPRDYYAIPAETQVIGAYAFAGCKNLRTIAFHKDINTIGYYAFDCCEGLEKTEYDGNGFQWDEIYIDNGNDNLKAVRPDGGFVYNIYSILGIPVLVVEGGLMWIWMAISAVILLPFALLQDLFNGELSLF